MKLKAKVEAQAAANPSAKRAGTRVASSGKSAVAAGLYSPDYWVSVPNGVPNPSAATYQGVDSWRLNGGTFMFGDIGGNQQQYVQWGKSHLVMQSDGNLVLYDENGGVRFRSNTYGHRGAYAHFQTDGNLVVYSSTGVALKASNTCCHTGWTFHVQEDGNLVIYAPVWSARWSSQSSH